MILYNVDKHHAASLIFFLKIYNPLIELANKMPLSYKKLYVMSMHFILTFFHNVDVLTDSHISIDPITLVELGIPSIYMFSSTLVSKLLFVGFEKELCHTYNSMKKIVGDQKIKPYCKFFLCPSRVA